MTSATALVRRPSSRLAEGLLTHLERRPVDFGRALEQWEGYVRVLREHGWATVEVPPADDCPDSAFVEDTVVMFRNVAVVSRPGADQRKPETVEVEKVVTALGCSVNAIRAPGTLDGGDVLKVGDTVYVGRGGRTNAEGVRQLRAILEPLGATVVAVPVTKVLHLKSAVTALPDGSVIGYPPLVDDAAVYPRFVPVPEEPGSHVVLLGGDRLLISSAAPRTAELLAGSGYTPVPVDIGEYEKLEGCVTCLSVRIRHLYG
ncbi:MAG: dimethylargininase [Actinomycetes bacterium]